MKSKILKITTVILLLAILTIPNLIYVGTGLVSYAVDNIATNHQNVEFDAKLKEGNILEVLVNVKKEGYLNGEISLENSNFTFDLNQENPYINKIESNKVVLNQINAGSSAQFDLKVMPITDELFDIGLLNTTSTVNLVGIYKDSTERDIGISSTREVKLEYTEENTIDNLENTTKIITNKVIKIAGEDRRVIQLEMNLGLKENNYPIEYIEVNMDVPLIDGKAPTVIGKVDFNTMSNYNLNYENNSEKSRLQVLFSNKVDEQNKAIWKKQGNEKLVLTFIYDKDAKVENARFVNPMSETLGQPITKVTLYNEKELTNISRLSVTDLGEEKEQLVNITDINLENVIYKGKLYAGIDREYETKTNIAVNLANAEQYIKIDEGESKYILNDGQEISANAIFNKTVINKKSFDEILGENGQITLSNGQGEIIATINSTTVADDNNNIIINYEDKELKTLSVRTSIPVKEGNLELVHTKTLKAQDPNILKSAVSIDTKSNYEYKENELKEKTSSIKLEETRLDASLVVNKDTLSTVIANSVEIKAILKGNNEQFELYKDPSIAIELPEETENITINDVALVYENELKVATYQVFDNKIFVYLQGEQSEYKNPSIEGAIIVVNADISINKKASTKDSNITMTVLNGESEKQESKNIKIVAPKDVTTINSIKELNIDTIGQEEVKSVNLERGKEAKQLEANIEVINNNENPINNVTIMGTFPTKNNKNNIDVKILEGIKLQEIEGVKVYYTEKEDATDSIENTSNVWKTEIEDANKVRKYLIQIPTVEAQTSISSSYKFEIPELLEYNQSTEEGYIVKYTNSLTNIESQISATNIVLETGIGPVIEAKLIPTVGGKEIKANETVKNGEVIKYMIEVSNIGSEELTNVLITGNVPEGTTLVVPQENYEYTGASYYKELENKTFDARLDKIAVGEVKTGTYEVRVNSDTQAGTILKNIIQLKYGDVIKQSNESVINTENGDIRVSVKRITDRKIDLYESGNVSYYAIVENISNNKQDNVQIEANIPKNFEIDGIILYTGMEVDEIIEKYKNNTDSSNESINELDNNAVANIGSLNKEETKVLIYNLSIGKTDNNPETTFSVLATSGDKQYRSNIIKEDIKKIDLSMNMTSNTSGQYIKSGDTIEYTIKIKNNQSVEIDGLTLKDKIPDSLNVTNVFFDNEEVQELKDINDIEMSIRLGANSEAIVRIVTNVRYSAYRDLAEPISNIAYIEKLGEKIATTSEVNHIIKADNEEPVAPTSDDPSGDIANGNGTITGRAWFDENANGKKDENEKTLNDVKAYLLNTATNNYVKDSNGKKLEVTTNDNGLYVLDHIANGKYIVVFDYNKTLYTLTKYKAENVGEDLNSNAMTNELLIENEKQQVTSTDIIEINDSNISNINIGLIELKDFAFRLDKYVSRILIQNSQGTIVKEYTNASVAKAELDGKKINGTTVIIEYELKVTNIGEIDGYVRKIVDYVPNDLKFSSELNKDWYQVGSDLYNASLANEKISAGESKSVRLTLTKSMTENNTGLINNTAEIAESYNELGIEDSKSKGGNKVQGENDYSSADTILSLKTGEEVYATFIVIGIILLGITAIIIVRKKQNIGDIK